MGVQRDSGAFVSPTAGDVLYPTAERFGGNAADLVEFRVKPRAGSILYRITLNAVKDDEAAAVGIGIDTGGGGGAPVAWPRGAGIASPGLDAFITAWGTGGEVALRPPGGSVLDDARPLGPRAVSIDPAANQITIRVPRSLPRMNPGRATWRYVAGVGLWSGTGFIPVPAAGAPTGTEPASGDPAEPAPGVFNLAFRFDEPQAVSGAPRYETVPRVGNWFEEEQSRALKAGSSGDLYAEVDFGALAAGAGRWLHAPGRTQARIYPSALQLHEGFEDEFPQYGGKLQPYLLSLPRGYRATRQPPGLTFTLHGAGATYTQFAVFSPRQIRELGDERNSIVVSPLARGPDGAYADEAEADFFETWADMARHFALAPDRVAITGYSMGGGGAYRLSTRSPDLFGRGFSAVAGARAPETFGGGPTANAIPLLGNLRWVPFLTWAEAADEIVPYTGPRETQDRFNSLGLRSQLWTFAPGDHFTLALADEWGPARDFLRNARVTRDPSRVDFAFRPVSDRPELGLVADHAHWLSGLSVRDPSGDPETNPVLGAISARSLAFGEGEPVASRIASAYPGPPTPATIDGTDWEAIPKAPRENALEVRLDNVGAARVAGRRARLRGKRPLRATITSDGDARLRLSLPLPAGETVTGTPEAPVPSAARGDGPVTGVRLGRAGATFQVTAGTRTYVLMPPHRL